MQHVVLSEGMSRKKIISDKILITDINNWGETSRSPRKELDVNDFTENGQCCRERSTLELKRRFFGNNKQVTMNAEGAFSKMKLSKREMATLHLDKRNYLQKSILSTKYEWMEGNQELQTFYIYFYKKRKPHDRENSRSVDVQDNVLVEPPPS